MEIDFTGYKKLVGTLGGVRVNVPRDAALQGVEGGAPPGPRPPITCSRSTTRPGRGGRAPAGNHRRERGPRHTDKPGFLSGRITTVDDLDPTDARRNLPRFSQANIDANLRIVDKLRELAAQRDADVAQLALAWVISQDVIPIPGTKQRRYLEQNAAAAAIELTPEEIAAIDAVSPHGVAAGERNTPEALKRDRI